MGALGQAQHRLPVAAHRHRALGDVAPRPDLAQRGELAQLAGRPALPREDLEPLAVARRARRIERDGDVHAPVSRGSRDDGGARAVAAGPREREEERHQGDGGRQGDGARRDRGQGGALALGHREALTHAGAEDAAGQRGGQGEHDGGHQHRRGPRMGHPHVAPAPLGREADRPDAQPAEQREAQRRARRGERRELDHAGLGDVEREVRRGVARDLADEERQGDADDEEHRERLEGAPGAEDRPRAHERDRGCEGDQHRLVEQLELRHAEVELRLEGRQADDERAGHAQVAAVRDLARAPELEALAHDHPHAERAHAGAADHEQVRRAPQRDVLAEERMPERVEREAEQRDAAADEHHDPARAHVQAQRQATLVARRGPAHPAVQQRGEDDALQARHDEHVRGREHALIAAVVDVVADVPVHPEDRDLQRDAGEDDGRDEAARDSRDALLVADEAMDELHG